MTEKPVSTQEVFWKAVQEARKAALKAEHEMRLTFDKEKAQFVLLDGLAPARIAGQGQETAGAHHPAPGQKRAHSRPRKNEGQGGCMEPVHREEGQPQA